MNPVYPPAAKKAGIQGIVVLRATIAMDGSVSNLEVLSGDPQLVKAALDAVQKWRYPSGDKALTTDVTINFTLAEAAAMAPEVVALNGGVGGGCASGGVTGGVRGGVAVRREWRCERWGLQRGQWC